MTDLLTLSGASYFTGLPPEELRKMIDEGKIEIVELPGGWKRFTRAELERVKRTSSKALV